jgi:hypothetical protein
VDSVNREILENWGIIEVRSSPTQITVHAIKGADHE